MFLQEGSLLSGAVYQGWVQFNTRSRANVLLVAVSRTGRLCVARRLHRYHLSSGRALLTFLLGRCPLASVMPGLQGPSKVLELSLERDLLSKYCLIVAILRLLFPTLSRFFKVVLICHRSYVK